MEQAAILKKDLVSKVRGIRIPKDTMVIYSTSMRAVKVNSKSNKSELWIGIKENDIDLVGWLRVK
jgi:hypothetical protein